MRRKLWYSEQGRKETCLHFGWEVGRNKSSSSHWEFVTISQQSKFILLGWYRKMQAENVKLKWPGVGDTEKQGKILSRGTQLQISPQKFLHRWLSRTIRKNSHNTQRKKTSLAKFSRNNIKKKQILKYFRYWKYQA